jgi:tetratricopeptide (TPR) repeat protein/DNA-binding XRE family transcriptional regulator
MSEVHAHPSAADGPREIGKISGRRGRRRGVEIKPGTVKQARFEAGLSLAQVAGGEISRTAIYFVETGKAKPSMETLKLIALRTGRPLDYFLSQPSTMEPRSTASTVEIERLLATGDSAGALADAEALLGSERDPEAVARIKFLMATAHLRLAQPVQARRLASSARAFFEQAGDLLMTAECLGSEASAAYLIQDPGAAALAEGALAICRGLNPAAPITEARLLAILGGVHATNRNWQGAIDAYELAIAAGEVVQDLRRLSIMYSGLSQAYQELGRISEAARYGHRALAIHETLSDRLSLARSENNLGMLLLKHGDLVDAQGHFDRALRLFEEGNVEPQRANLLMSMCELEFLREDLAAAEHWARQALEFAGRASEPINVGESHVWLGRIAEARGDHLVVDAEFHAACDLFEESGVGEPLSRAHADYAEILEARGDIAGAVQHLKQALAARPSQRAVDSRAAIA